VIDAQRIYRIGDVVVTRVTETRIEFSPPDSLLPGWKPDAIVDDKQQLAPSRPADSRERIVTSVHTWVVSTRDSTILIDTGIGNGKTRPVKYFDHLDSPFLDRLLAAAVTPQRVSHVLITHIHTDHVGWNTVLVDRRWSPTFPNATYVFPRLGHEYFSFAEGRARPNYGMYEDSILPVISAGQASMIGPEGAEVLPGIKYIPTPGHSIDHMSISLHSQGEEALFAGDVMHNPLQVLAPHLSSIFCADPEKAMRSRLRILEHCAGHNATYFSSHFAETSAGRIFRANGAYRWRFE
jgi:glyoxylase-like metal-dependent hydrolase (beta-lactamase superfamily II)